MKNLNEENKIAVLIDAENTQCALLSAVLAELSKHGHIVTKKAYGDWSSPHLKNWKQPLNDLAITPVQQFAYTQGKNSSDAAMIIDAMDLLYSDNFDAFALVTSDSDFTKLASRLKESQAYVFGVGEKHTPSAFRNACDDFISAEVLNRFSPIDEEAPDESPPAQVPREQQEAAELRNDTKLINLLSNAINENADDDGWALLGPCGNLIKRQHPDFDPRTYGYEKLTQLIEATELFEIDKRPSSNGNTTINFVKKSVDELATPLI